MPIDITPKPCQRAVHHSVQRSSLGAAVIDPKIVGVVVGAVALIAIVVLIVAHRPGSSRPAPSTTAAFVAPSPQNEQAFVDAVVKLPPNQRLAYLKSHQQGFRAVMSDPGPWTTELNQAMLKK